MTPVENAKLQITPIAQAYTYASILNCNGSSYVQA